MTQNMLQMINFLGTINFYCCFVPAAARTVKLLTDALKGACSQKAPFSWKGEMREAFKAAKEVLGTTTMLDHPQKKAELAIMVDTS